MAEDWGDDVIEEDCVFAHVTSDRFGVPSNIMGRHNEEFFAMLGRIVALAAILEYKILVFYQYLVGRRQDVFTEPNCGQAHCPCSREPVQAERAGGLSACRGVPVRGEGSYPEEERVRPQPLASPERWTHVRLEDAAEEERKGGDH